MELINSLCSKKGGKRRYGKTLHHSRLSGGPKDPGRCSLVSFYTLISFGARLVLFRAMRKSSLSLMACYLYGKLALWGLDFQCDFRLHRGQVPSPLPPLPLPPLEQGHKSQSLK